MGFCRLQQLWPVVTASQAVLKSVARVQTRAWGAGPFLVSGKEATSVSHFLR